MLEWKMRIKDAQLYTYPPQTSFRADDRAATTSTKAVSSHTQIESPRVVGNDIRLTAVKVI